MRFLVDNQLPVALARWLAGTGSQADHVLDLHLQNATDTEIWSLSNADGRIIVSKDVDFLLLANRPHDTGRLQSRAHTPIGSSRKNTRGQRHG